MSKLKFTKPENTAPPSVYSISYFNLDAGQFDKLYVSQNLINIGQRNRQRLEHFSISVSLLRDDVVNRPADITLPQRALHRRPFRLKERIQLLWIKNLHHSVFSVNVPRSVGK